jgi:hypothetical protein
MLSRFENQEERKPVLFLWICPKALDVKCIKDMKWTIENIEDKNYIRVNSEGKFNLDDHRRKLAEIVSKEYWTPGMNILFDCTEVDFSGKLLEDVREVLSDFADRNELIGCGKIAMLMKSLADYGRGRQFQILTTVTTDKICSDIGIFLDEKQSLDWLDSSK